MATSEHTIVINKPIDYVFYNTTCMRGCVNWMSTVMSAEKIGDAPVQVGTQYKHTYKFMSNVGETFVTIQVYNPPYEFAFVDPSYPVEFHYTFEEVPEGTRVHVLMTVTPREGSKLDAETISAGAKKQFDESLGNQKTMLESDIAVRVE